MENQLLAIIALQCTLIGLLGVIIGQLSSIERNTRK